MWMIDDPPSCLFDWEMDPAVPYNASSIYEIIQNYMNHTRQYTIVHSDTSDHHQYSVIVRNATITVQTYPVDN